MKKKGGYRFPGKQEKPAKDAGHGQDVELLNPNEIIKSKDSRDDRIEFKRNVTLLNGVGIIVGSIIGSGIFVTPKDVYVYAQSSYGAIAIWALAGLFSLIGAICFTELGTSITRSGGDYAYILEAFGPLPGFLCLFVTIAVIRPVTAAVIALTFAEYAIKPFFPHCHIPDYAPQLLAAVCLCFLTAVNCMSVKITMKVQNIFTAAKLISLAAIIIAGLTYFIMTKSGAETTVDLSKNVFAQPFDFKGESFSVTKLSLSFYNGLFAYAGWNYLNFVTQELKNPYKNLPRAIFLGIPIVTGVYILTNLAYYAILTPEEMTESAAVAVAFGQHTFGQFQWVIPIFVALSTFGGVNGTIFTSARMYFAGANEHQLPQIFKCIHLRSYTPVPALLLQCLLSLLFLAAGSIQTLIGYVSFILWVSTGVSVAALLVLRRTKPELPRPIRVNLFFPIVYIISTIFIVGCSVVADWQSTLYGTIITLAGIPVYYLLQLLMKMKTTTATNILQKILVVLPQDAPETIL